MSDKQYALDRAKDFDGLSDDDPLAALARVGISDRPITVQRSFVPERRAPEFDLEDELLRAFELYDTPRPDRKFFDTEPSGVKVQSEGYPVIEPEPQWEAVESREISDEPLRISSVYQEFEPDIDPIDGETFEADVSDGFEGQTGEASQILAPENPKISEDADPDWDSLFADFAPDALKEGSLKDLAFKESEPEQSEVFVSPDHAGIEIAQHAEPEEIVPEEILHDTGYDTGEFEPDHLLDEMRQFPISTVNPDWTRPTTIHEFDQQDVFEATAIPPSRGEDFLPAANENWPSFAAEADEPPELPELSEVSERLELTELLGLAELTEAPGLPAMDEMVLAENENPFEDYSFELDIGAIEMDLAELDSDNKATVSAIAPVMVPIEMDRWKQESVGFTPITPNPGAVLPFDPAQIAQTEEPFHAIAEMDVPDLPVDDATEPALEPDYDIDIDTEMAKMFARPIDVQSRNSQSNHSIETPDRQSVANPAPGSYAQSDPIDEFERALEEDFHRSLQPEIAGTGVPKRVKLIPSALSYVATPNGQSRRFLLLASSVGAIILLGGVGVYAFLSTGYSLPGSGEPRIILADKAPVKLVPENRGGRTVPNQDKAVYDRVAGAANEVPKQESLVSSTEEPVDVVQKTLVPENLPMNDDGGAATPTGDTADARLLPDGETNNEPVADNPVDGVQVRKVQTMIVRPDGTLVPRGEPATRSGLAAPIAEPNITSLYPQSDIQAAASNLTTEAKPQTIDVANPTGLATVDSEVLPKADAGSSVLAENATEPPVELGEPTLQTSEPVIPPDQTQAIEPSAIEAAALADVQEDTPVRVVKTSKITLDAPVPQSRPADQPVNVVSTINEQGITVASQEIASAQPISRAARQTSPEVQVPSGTYVIQIASLPSELDAQNSYQKLSGKFANVIGGRGVDIKRAEIAGKGTFYRIRIAAGSKQDAVDLCSRYKKAGGSCLVSR